MSVETAAGPIRFAGGRNTTDYIIPLITAQATLTTHPNSLQFLGNSSQWIWKLDLTGYEEVRLTARVATASASANNPRIGLVCHTAFSTTVTDYATIGNSVVECSLFTGQTLPDTGWIKINPARAIDNLFLALTQNGGDGAASPVVGQVFMHLR